MSKLKRAIFYLTSNGVYNNTNGIGTQTKTLLSGISQHYSDFAQQFGDFALHVITPSCTDYAFDGTGHIQFAKQITQKTGGDIHFCPRQIDNTGFWNVESWKSLSTAAATIILSHTSYYDDILVIAVDPPFLGTPLIIELSRLHKKPRVQSVIALYGNSYIHDKQNITASRLGWEYIGISSARLYKNIKIGKICNFLEKQLIENYGAPKDEFVPFESSILLTHSDFIPLKSKERDQIIMLHKIPMEKPILLAFGRLDWIKGFDILLDSLNSLRGQIHLVLILVPFSQNDPLLQAYKDLIKNNNIDCTLITNYNRELPKALCQHQNTKIVVCPSRGEACSNIPLEVGLWARQEGPVIVSSNVDGFTEQIVDGYNGFLFDINSENSLEQKINAVLKLSDEALANIRHNAFEKVIQERDFYKNFGDTLNYFWN